MIARWNTLLAAAIAAAPTLLGQGVLTSGQPTRFAQSGMYSCQGPPIPPPTCYVVSGLYNIVVPQGATQLDVSVTVDAGKQWVEVYILFGSTISQNSSGGPVGTGLKYLGYADSTQALQASIVAGNSSPGALSLVPGTWTIGLYMEFSFLQTLSTSGTILATVTSPSPPSINSGGVVSASAFGEFHSAAPGSWIEIYGSNLAADTRGWEGSDFNGVNAPTSLDGTSVTIGSVSAFVGYISSGQVNVQVPNVAAGSQPLVVNTGAGSSPAYTLTIEPVDPGLLAPPTFKINGVQYVVALDGSNYVLPMGAIAGLTSAPANPGDVIVLYGVGFGPVSPTIQPGQIVQQMNQLPSFSISIGGVPATVQYAGLAPNYVGLYQFNIVVPQITANGAAPVALTVNATQGTQTLYLAVN